MKKTYTVFTYGLAERPLSGRPAITFDSFEEARSYLYNSRKDAAKERERYGGTYKLHDWVIIEQKVEQTFDDNGYFLNEIITRKAVAVEKQL